MAVDAFVALMVGRLDKLLSKEPQLLRVHGEIKHIRQELDQMRGFLEDADIKQKENEDVRDWMENIRDICFDVDDVIDILGQDQAAQGRHGYVELLKGFFSDRITRRKVGKEIERIKLNIKGITRRRESYGITKTKESSSAEKEEEEEARAKVERAWAKAEARAWEEITRAEEEARKRRFVENIIDSVTPGKIEKAITRVDDQLTNEERTRDIDEGRQEASSSSRNLQAHRPVSTLPGEPEEVGLQEEINTVGQEEPRLWDGTRDISEGKLEASSSTPGLKADRVFSTLLRDSEDVGLQEGINTVGQQLMGEELGSYDGTRDFDEGIREDLPFRKQARAREEEARAEDAARAREEEARADEEARPPEKIEKAITRVDDQLTNEERTRDIGEGRQEASSSEAVVSYIERKLGDLLIDISRRRETYGISDINEGRQEASSSRQSLEAGRRFSALLEEPEVVGQQEEISTLKKQLISGEQRRCVISIFGMGGLGKTTLARQVYDDVKNDFDCHAFICLSQQYEIKDVLIRLITCVMSKSRAEIENLHHFELGKRLRNHLEGKKYLVVMDDIWSKEAWDMFRFVLPNGRDQSRVVLTTRIKEVAVHADPVSPLHEMRLLNDNEGWELFMKKVFPGENPSAACPSELKEIGREIFAKCGGLPLAILVLGGLLATKEKTFSAWSEVLKSVKDLSGSFDRLRRTLALSYWDLPHYLKPCFLYFGLFPEDYEISSGKLIRLWIAEGFIQQKDNELMEDVAEDYLVELVGRSMIQVANKKSNGSIHKCRIHYLFRQLSIYVARENNFFTVHNDDDTSSSSTSVRRLAIYGNIDGDWTKNHSIENLHSILCFGDSNVLKFLNTNGKLLRVMNVEGSQVSLPKEVGGFVLLKFLEFSGEYSLCRIPPSIGNLSSLQTLKVHCGSLPNTIWNLKELRHLDATYVEGDPHLSNLKNLQTLTIWAGNGIKEGLGKLTNLRKLRIYGDMSSYHDTMPYCIEKLCNLRSLTLIGSPDKLIPPFQPFTLHLDLYEILLYGSIKKLPELPPNLVLLALSHSELQQDAIFTLEKLQHLKILRLILNSYISKQMICSSGGFPRLEFLELRHLPLVEEWIVEEGAMISLKSVQLSDMTGLKFMTLPERVRALFNEELV